MDGFSFCEEVRLRCPGGRVENRHPVSLGWPMIFPHRSTIVELSATVSSAFESRV